MLSFSLPPGIMQNKFNPSFRRNPFKHLKLANIPSLLALSSVFVIDHHLKPNRRWIILLFSILSTNNIPLAYPLSKLSFSISWPSSCVLWVLVIQPHAQWAPSFTKSVTHQEPQACSVAHVNSHVNKYWVSITHQIFFFPNLSLSYCILSSLSSEADEFIWAFFSLPFHIQFKAFKFVLRPFCR